MEKYAIIFKAIRTSPTVSDAAGRESFTRMMTGYDYRIAGRNHAKQYLVDDIADAEVKKGGQQ